MLSPFSKFKLSFFKANRQAGFTIAEMVTVVAIIVIMTGVVLANLPEFRDRSSLELVAQEMALVIRQAQAFGANTRAAQSSTSFQFPSYGVFFNLNDETATRPPGASGSSFILFADQDPGSGPDNHFSDGEDETCGTIDVECREVFRFQGGLSIADYALCSGGDVCSSVNTQALSIIFKRPNPEARFVQQNGNDFLCSGVSCSYVKITLRSARNNATRCIYAWSTGHIYTKSC